MSSNKPFLEIGSLKKPAKSVFDSCPSLTKEEFLEKYSLNGLDEAKINIAFDEYRESVIAIRNLHQAHTIYEEMRNNNSDVFWTCLFKNSQGKLLREVIYYDTNKDMRGSSTGNSRTRAFKNIQSQLLQDGIDMWQAIQKKQEESIKDARLIRKQITENIRKYSNFGCEILDISQFITIQRAPEKQTGLFASG